MGQPGTQTIGRPAFDRQSHGRLGCEAVQPLAGGHRLARRRVIPETAPVAFGLNRLIRDRSLHDKDEWVEFATVRLMPPLDKRVRALLRPALEIDQGPVHSYLRQSGQGAERDFLDAGLCCRGECDRVAVTPQPAVHPEDVNYLVSGIIWRGVRLRACGNCTGSHVHPSLPAERPGTICRVSYICADAAMLDPLRPGYKTKQSVERTEVSTCPETPAAPRCPCRHVIGSRQYDASGMPAPVR